MEQDLNNAPLFYKDRSAHGCTDRSQEQFRLYKKGARYLDPVPIHLPKRITLVEVGPRDGLQNETKNIPTEIKIAFINQLSETGLSVIEATSFVSPHSIPSLADHAAVFTGIQKKVSVRYPVLIPNTQGLEAALAVGVKEIAVFTTPSEIFSEKNTHCSVYESMQRIRAVVNIAKQHRVRIRAYLSCVLGCPYMGEIKPQQVAELANQLYAFGCDEIALGDTIGVGSPCSVQRLLEAVGAYVPIEQLAVHFHDTYGQALVNIYAALLMGVSVVDSAVAGLGGCPYAKGATGNVATEEVVYMLHHMGIQTGVDLQKLVAVGQFISQQLGRTPQSKVNVALSAL